ncbi:MAG: aldo/keto reductase [Thermanaerothrix sp.]|nr:aldo/keto reductase [Thermanaerothrix sp.]
MSKDPVERLALGGAQLGLAYGIRGSAKPDYGRALEILSTALEEGFCMVDTACLYGSSHEFIGMALGELGASMKVVTKLPTMRAGDLEEALAKALQDLRTPKVYGLMAHHGKDFNGPLGEEMASFLSRQRDLGLAYKIGFSCYSPEEALAASGVLAPQVVQLPLNALDQRFLASGALKRFKAMGAEIHVRSCFLQGLLLMDPAEGAEKVKGAGRFLERFAERASDFGLSSMELALGFCLSIEEVDRVVVGVDSPSQVSEIVLAARSAAGRVRPEDLEDLMCFDEAVIDPRTWG